MWAAGVQMASGYDGSEFGMPVVSLHKQDIADGDWMWMDFSKDQKIR